MTFAPSIDQLAGISASTDNLTGFGLPSDDLAAFSRVVVQYCERPVVPDDNDALAADLLLKRALINRLELDFARDAARLDAA